MSYNITKTREYVQRERFLALLMEVGSIQMAAWRYEGLHLQVLDDISFFLVDYDPNDNTYTVTYTGG